MILTETALRRGERWSDQFFDVVVIGAGIAGTLVAIGLARRGLNVLLVEAKKFPREKVCGCCLNRRGQEVLQRFGLLDAVEALGGVAVTDLRLAILKSHHRWRIPPMLATSRSALDELLFNAASEAGAVCIDECPAKVLPQRADLNAGRTSRDGNLPTHRVVALQAGRQVRNVTCRLVISADGLTHSSLSELPEFKFHVARSARVGLHCILDACSQIDREFRPGELTMAVSPGGYVGLTNIEGGRLDIAAAVDTTLLRKGDRPVGIVTEVLERCGLSVPTQLATTQWRGTPPLTRRSHRVAGERLLLVGDAVGYVEPFTGEGMSWAAAAAEALVPLAARAVEHWTPEVPTDWEELLRRKIFRNQWMCRLTTQLTRSTAVAALAATACDRIPALRQHAIRMCGGSQDESETPGPAAIL